MLLLLRANSAAGPSRHRIGLGLAAFHTTSRASAAAASIPPFKASNASLNTKVLPTLPQRITRLPPLRAVPKLSEKAWPWYQIESAHKGMVEEERVIYARPAAGEPKMYWAMALVWFFGVVTYVVIPSPRAALELEHGPSYVEDTILQIPKSMWWTYGVSGAMAVTTVGAFFCLAFPTRMITRLSLVRTRPTGAPISDSRQFLRMKHLGHDMVWGKRSHPRELAVDDVRVNLILGRPTATGIRVRNPWISLTVTSPHHPIFSFDSRAYRLDFRETEALKMDQGEVVLSLARIEDVFGTLRPSDEAVAVDITEKDGKSKKSTKL